MARESIAERLARAADLHRRRDLAAAARLYRAILDEDARQPDALHLLGLVRFQQGAHEEGVALIRQAIAVTDKPAVFHQNLGHALRAAGDTAGARAAYEKALARDARLTDSAVELARLERERGDAAAALRVAEAGLASGATGWALQAQRGLAFDALGQYEEGVAAFSAALKAPGAPRADVLDNRGVCQQKRGAFDAALMDFEAALAEAPEHRLAAWHRAVTLRAACDWRDDPATDAAFLTRLDADMAAGRFQPTPFEILTMDTSPAQQRLAARAWITAHAPAQPPLRGSGPVVARARSRLRLGYLSNELREHPMGWLLANLFECHDRSRFEVTAYSFSHDPDTEMVRRLRQGFDRWISVHRLSAREAAARIHADDIDILIDLKGMTPGGRPHIAAFRPASVQVNWLGCPATMGAPYIDYMIVDRHLVPSEEMAQFDETLVFMPHTYQVTDPLRPIGPKPSRAACGLPEHGFVFCCFNQSHKITAPIFALWLEILAAVPGSVLWLLAKNDVARRNLRAQVQQAGLDPERLIFAEPLPHTEHLGRMGVGDLFLDTLPYGAHATASDALWAGLPLLTLVGRTASGRVAASLLRAMGLHDLVTDKAQAYRDRAIALACDPGAYQALRARLAAARDESPVFDCAGFTRALEAAFEMMWDAHRAGGPKAAFSVRPDSQ